MCLWLHTDLFYFAEHTEYNKQTKNCIGTKDSDRLKNKWKERVTLGWKECDWKNEKENVKSKKKQWDVYWEYWSIIAIHKAIEKKSFENWNVIFRKCHKSVNCGYVSLGYGIFMEQTPFHCYISYAMDILDDNIFNFNRISRVSEWTQNYT